MKTFKFLIISLILIFVARSSPAQTTMLEDFSYEYLDKLIEAAKLNSPRMKGNVAKIDAAKENVKMEKANWLTPLSFSYFWRSNEQATNLVDPRLFSGYQFGINLNPGELLNRTYLVKRSKKEVEAAFYESKEYEQQLVAEVKSRYVTYIESLNSVKLQAKSIVEAQNIVSQLKISYQKGETTLKEYNEANMQLNESIQTKIRYESRALAAKFAIEELTITKLEEIK